MHAFRKRDKQISSVGTFTWKCIVHAVFQETSGLAQLFELKIKYVSDFMGKKVILLNMKEPIFHECENEMLYHEHNALHLVEHKI